MASGIGYFRSSGNPKSESFNSLRSSVSSRSEPCSRSLSIVIIFNDPFVRPVHRTFRSEQKLLAKKCWERINVYLMDLIHKETSNGYSGSM